MKTAQKVLLGLVLVAIIGVASVAASHRIAKDDENPAEEEPGQMTPQEAMNIATSAVDTEKVGEITDVELETVNGIAAYAVEFRKDGVETDVKLDAVTGNILVIEDDTTETDEEDEDD
jgi:uncharacterized membrane protein YkoI